MRRWCCRRVGESEVWVRRKPSSARQKDAVSDRTRPRSGRIPRKVPCDVDRIIHSSLRCAGGRDARRGCCGGRCARISSAEGSLSSPRSHTISSSSSETQSSRNVSAPRDVPGTSVGTSRHRPSPSVRSIIPSVVPSSMVPSRHSAINQASVGRSSTLAVSPDADTRRTGKNDGYATATRVWFRSIRDSLLHEGTSKSIAIGILR
mmetsp:Transcript_6909/g.16929  ORF Transcript_6909/g.16929 Transcript_6909/m.16929 type:complete len:205 (-) Transcript_6909:465-1079(-)